MLRIETIATMTTEETKGLVPVVGGVVSVTEEEERQMETGNTIEIEKEATEGLIDMMTSGWSHFKGCICAVVLYTCISAILFLSCARLVIFWRDGIVLNHFLHNTRIIIIIIISC